MTGAESTTAQSEPAESETAESETAESKSRRDWLTAAAVVLRRTGRLRPEEPDDLVLQLLRGKTIEGLAIPVLGTASAGSLPEPGVPGRPPFLRGEIPDLQPGAPVIDRHGWDIRSLLRDPDPRAAAAAALSDLEGGVNSLWVRVGVGGTALSDLSDVLADVRLDLAPVVFDPSPEIRLAELSEQLRRLVDGRAAPLHPHSNLGIDPIGARVRAGDADRAAGNRTPDGDRGRSGELVRDSVRAALLHGIRAFVVDATVAHDHGAGDAAELGYALAVGVEYLRAVADGDDDPAAALQLFEFRYAATGEQFITLAKFRAARLLWDRVGELSGAADRRAQAQHAVTSLPMMTRYDSYTNLLRTTVAAFAAGVGGAQAVTVLPFDSALGIPDALGRRLARNISSLLIGESHVAAVADPAGGAPAVETLTAELAAAGWAEFQRIEASGGAWEAIRDGSAQLRWRDTARRRGDLVARRVLTITGISEYPIPGEVLPVRRPETVPGQQISSWSEVYEQMRDHPPAQPVFVALLGPVSAHGSRAAYLTNALAVGGIEILSAGIVSGHDEIFDAYTRAGAPPVVCLAGSDRSYLDDGDAVVDGLRAAGAQRLILAGRPPAALIERVDDRLAAGDDLVQFLQRTRAALCGAVAREGDRS